MNRNLSLRNGRESEGAGGGQRPIAGPAADFRHAIAVQGRHHSPSPPIEVLYFDI